MFCGSWISTRGTFVVYPPYEWKTTYFASDFTFTSANRSWNETPCQSLSNFDQVVTQWMSLCAVVCGSAMNSSHVSVRSEEHTSELQSLMRISYAVFCLKKKNNQTTTHRPLHPPP